MPQLIFYVSSISLNDEWGSLNSSSEIGRATNTSSFLRRPRGSEQFCSFLHLQSNPEILSTPAYLAHSPDEYLPPTTALSLPCVQAEWRILSS